MVLSLASTGGSHSAVPDNAVYGQPQLIPEGPMGVPNAGSGSVYWFQQGAIGRTTPVCDTCNSVGASISIRTVSDQVNNDAHSYWVGSILRNGAFVQVGYLNGLTTTNQPYCCAWFYEYFPPGNTVSPPIIGPPKSAGAIGSWHTYSMNYNATAGVGVWSFYMDNVYLGSSPTSGHQYYLGSSATDSGGHPIAALSEVAQTTVNTDIIGPAEFKNLLYETSPNAWNPVPNGQVHWGYGVTSSMNLSNPYSVAEIVGVPNDFLTGSDVQYPGPSAPGVDECGSPASSGGSLWPVTPCVGGTTNSFSFTDMDGSSIVPSWISLVDSSNTQIFYSDYQNYQSVTVPSPTGQWTINQVSWHSVNVAIPVVFNTTGTNRPILTNVFSIKVSVVGYIYSIPVKNATVILTLPDSTNQTLKTDVNGEAVFSKLPPSTYSLRIFVPYGITSNQVKNILTPGSIVAKVFSLPELITIIVPPLLITIVAAIAAVRREHRRQAMIQSQPGQQPMSPSFCRSCGLPVSPTANFCTNCGTPRQTATQ